MLARFVGLAAVASLAAASAAGGATSSAPGRVVFAAPPGAVTGGDGSRAHPFLDLQRAAEAVRGGGTVRLLPGRYLLRAVPYVDSTCANCLQPDTLLSATRALNVSGHDLRLVGAGADSTVLVTGAGYGVLFERCARCVLDSLGVTGGARDSSGMASDAAVVVKGGQVTVYACRLAENLGDSATVARTVVGIAGLVARDAAVVNLEANRIERNSWDGVALYRGVRARVVANWIDGVDRAVGGRHGGGRGVGIGCTWDARAEIRGNAVRRYWKGIGALVDARVEASENVVENIATWGLALWDADLGAASADFSGNAVYRTGACGILVSRGDRTGPVPGAVVDNLVVETGANPRYDSGEVYCTQTSLALDRAPAGLRLAGNLFFRNREPGDLPGSRDLAPEVFLRRAVPLIEHLWDWPILRQTDFLTRFAVRPRGAE